MSDERSQRRHFLVRLFGAVAGLTSAVIAIPLSLGDPARRRGGLRRTVRLRVRALTRRHLYGDHDLAG